MLCGAKRAHGAALGGHYAAGRVMLVGSKRAETGENSGERAASRSE